VYQPEALGQLITQRLSQTRPGETATIGYIELFEVYGAPPNFGSERLEAAIGAICTPAGIVWERVRQGKPFSYAFRATRLTPAGT
jgi:hypothetical protein